MQKDQIFENYQLNEESTEFNKCTFKSTIFSGQDLTKYEFIDCTFNSCDFSSSRFENLVLTRAKFICCKMIGIDFSKCSRYTFSATFDNCILNYCVFIKNNLKKTLFKKCIIREALFSESDLNYASFPECDLTATVFDKCDLMDCDFRTAENYSLNPSLNKIKNAKFSYPGVLGLLSYFKIIIED